MDIKKKLYVYPTYIILQYLYLPNILYGFLEEIFMGIFMLYFQIIPFERIQSHGILKNVF